MFLYCFETLDQRLLLQNKLGQSSTILGSKVIYMGESKLNLNAGITWYYAAPSKALVTEKLADWRSKFEDYGPYPT